MNIKAILEKRKAQLEANAAILARVEARGFVWEGTEKADVQAGADRIKELDEMVETTKAALQAEGNLAAASFGVSGSNDDNGPDKNPLRNFRTNTGAVDAAAVMQAMQAFGARNQKDASKVVSHDGPFRTLGEQVKAVIAAGKNPHKAPDERLFKVGATTHGANESVDADGGFLVQSEFMQPMLDNIILSGQIASMCTRFTTSAPSVVLPRLKETSRADGSRYGGVRAYWAGEGDQITGSKPQFERLNVPVDKLAVLVPVTEELSQDAPFLGGWINTLGGAEMSFKLDDALIRGTGQGMPLGILNANCLVTAAATSQDADTIVSDNIFAMYGRMLPRSKKKGQWMGNQELYEQLLKLKADDDRNIFLPGLNIANEPVDRLLGRTYQEVEQCSAPGDVGDLIFADWSQYLLIDRGSVQTDVSIHFYFDTAENAVRLMLRVGGVPMPSAPLTPYKGTKTLSPFVALAAR